MLRAAYLAALHPPRLPPLKPVLPPLIHPGVPIPEHLAAEGQEIEAATATALAEAEAQGIQGAEITPFMLDRIQVLTQGRSLAANIQLILNNARVGAEVAVELSRLRRGGQGQATEG